MRYILVRKKTMLLDQETGIRWHVPPEVADLFDKKKVVVFKAPKPWKDPIPLARSCQRGAEVVSEKYFIRRASQHWPARGKGKRP